MVPKLEIGLVWGSLEVVEIAEAWREVRQGAITEATKDKKAIARCRCGGSVEIWASKWKGYRSAGYDCGCGLGAVQRARVAVCVTMPIELKDKIMKRAQNDRGFSAELCRLVRAGLEVDKNNQ